MAEVGEPVPQAKSTLASTRLAVVPVRSALLK